MIASLTGTLLTKGMGDVVVDVGGVGYLVHVSLQTLAELPAEGERVALLCHTHVREDALQLFGFVDPRERRVFGLLIGVSGVGPKLALTILSGMPVAQIINAVAEGNLQRLMSIPGVGKKTGERLIVELKDRLARLAATLPPSAEVGSPELEHLVEALVGLGYKRPLAAKAVTRAAQEAPGTAPEQLLRRALAAIQSL